MTTIVRLDQFISPDDYSINKMSTSSTSSSSSNVRSWRMFRFAVFAFAIGLCMGQLTNNKASMKEYVQSFDVGSIKSKIARPKIERVKSTYGPIKRISLLGERNSGTTWMTEELTNCFAESGILVTNSLTKEKHFFQKDDSTEPKLSTVVVGMFRDPYDWSLAMQKRPHHSPEHLGLPIDQFLTKPWGMERPERDLQYANMTGPICQQVYGYKDIVPCLKLKSKPLDFDEKLLERTGKHTGYSAWDPQYELRADGSQLPYDSLLHLRQAKIKNILDIENWSWIAHLEVVNYETLLKDGTEQLLKKLEDMIGVKMQCTPSPPAPERIGKYTMEPETIKLINTWLNWDVEALIGYSKRSSKKNLRA